MDYPNHGRGLASLCRDTKARPSHPRDRSGLTNRRHYPSHHREPTSHNNYADVTEFLPQFRKMAAEAGRDAGSTPVTIWGAPDNLDRVKRYRDQGIARVVVSLPSAPSAEILPTLDRWAEIIGKTAN